MNNEKKTSDRSDAVANRMYLNRWKQCERRVPRAAVEHSLHALRIQFNNHAQAAFHIRTIGELGAFCAHPTAQTLAFKLGQEESLTLFVEDERFDLTGNIRYVQRDGFGLEFIEPPQSARQKIQNLMGPEFLAATLTPFFAPITMVPGATRTLIYSDGGTNYLHVSLADHKILAVDLELEILGFRFLWRKKDGQKPEEFRHGDNRAVAEKRILSFLRNLPGLAIEHFKEIEQVFKAGRALE
jgi:hypothetical protein